MKTENTQLILTTVPLVNNPLISFFFILLYFTLQYRIGFAIHQNESATGVQRVPYPEPPLNNPLISIF